MTPVATACTHCVQCASAYQSCKHLLTCRYSVVCLLPVHTNHSGNLLQPRAADGTQTTAYEHRFSVDCVKAYNDKRNAQQAAQHHKHEWHDGASCYNSALSSSPLLVRSTTVYVHPSSQSAPLQCAHYSVR
eukprot:17864-Heterococcus_DN1.PRE.4